MRTLQYANAIYTGWMSERSKERDSRAANDFKTVWLRKAVLAHERVRSFACAMHSWVRTPLQPIFFLRFEMPYLNACYASSVRISGSVTPLQPIFFLRFEMPYLNACYASSVRISGSVLYLWAEEEISQRQIVRCQQPTKAWFNFFWDRCVWVMYEFYV